jgi:hypothetical protein
LRQLASGASAAGARLERLRFYIDRTPSPLSLLCARLADGEGKMFLVVASPAPARLAAEASAPAPSPEAPVEPAPASEPPPREAAKDVARFLWSMTDTLRFEASPLALVEAIGEAAPRTAEPFDVWNARTGLDAGGQLARALASQATFGPLRLAGPAPGDAPAATIVVALSGAPIFDRERRFQGYRGFGLVTREASPPREARAPESREADAPSPRERREIAAPAPLYPAAPNVVPIRPGALRVPPIDEPPSNGDSVELTRLERDAFREIARALGARVKDDGAAEPARARPPKMLPASEARPARRSRRMRARLAMTKRRRLAMRASCSTTCRSARW